METLPIKPIGRIRTGFTQATGTPLHSVYAGDAPGTVELDPEYAEGLRDIEAFSRLWLLFWCHRARASELIVTPYRDTASHGVFSTRTPARPNPIGLSAVKLESVEGNILHVSGVDMLDGSILLDVKPYVSEYDSFSDEASGWVDTSDIAESVVRADARFERSDEA